MSTLLSNNKNTPVEIRSQNIITVAVLADTHIPDRVKRLHPQLIPNLKSKPVDLILHAGDISQEKVLENLNDIAPVYAVRGNRDFLLTRSLPVTHWFLINKVKVFLTHGHLDVYHYWRDKVENLLHGYRFERYRQRLLGAAAGADVIIYGHSHHAENQFYEQKWFFNPGSCSVAEKPDFRLSFGIIRFHPGGEVETTIVSLD